MVLDPDFLKKHEKFGDSRIFEAYILYRIINISMDFQDLWA